METTLKDYRRSILTVKDRVTGFIGTVTGHADYITGCDQYLVQPPAKDGKWEEGRWFDHARLDITQVDGKEFATEDLLAEENGADAPAPIK